MTESLRGKGRSRASESPCIVFHDQGFVDLQRNLCAFRNGSQRSLEIFSVHFKIGQHRPGRTSCQSLLHDEHLLTLLLEGDYLSRSQAVRGAVDLSTIYEYMSVDNQLSRSQKSRSEPETINNVIQPTFKKAHERFARNPRFLKSLFYIISELLFGNPIGESQLLLLQQALLVFAHFPSEIRVHSRRG